MIHYDHYISGSLLGVRYRFAKAGEKIPEHLHRTPDLFHNIIVLKGAIQFKMANSLVDLDAGSFFDFDGTQPHEISALQDDTLTVHFLLNPTRELQEALRDHEGDIE